MAVTNTLAYNKLELVTTVKSVIVQAPSLNENYVKN